ncbi:unnamed protein product [Amaranthus hypochondriacus]
MADSAELENEQTNHLEDDSQTSEDSETATTTTQKWPGWPGYNVFRLIVPVNKVGSIIGRKGELVKKICDDTGARVMISAKEELDAPVSPAMNAAIRTFKRVSGIGEGDDKSSAADVAAFCSIRLLVSSAQALMLIGKQGSTIKSLKESSGAGVRILPEGELPLYATSDERLVEIHGETFKVQKALEGILGHLRKFLHDYGVLPMFENTCNATFSQDQATNDSLAQNRTSVDNSLLLKRQSYFEHQAELDLKFARSAVSLYGSDQSLSSLHSARTTRASAPLVTQVTHTMQVPFSYAEDIIGIAGRNIAYIRRSSGAVLSVLESQGRGDEITIEIKGTATEVQIAQQLIQDSINGPKAATSSSIYGRSELGLGASSYLELSESTYNPSSFTSLSSYSSQGLGGDYTSGLGDYSHRYRY